MDRLSFFAGIPDSEDLHVNNNNSTQSLNPSVDEVTVPPPQLEPLQQASRLVLFTDATYIILCPGDQEELRRIADYAGQTWGQYPFVADSTDLNIIMQLTTDTNMRLDRGQAIPAILEYDGSNQFVDLGRRYYPF